jgi:hypothetical protein
MISAARSPITTHGAIVLPLGTLVGFALREKVAG